MQVGDQIGPYTVVEHIGRGGMADVWSARDARLERTVAIKTIMADLSNEQMRAQFEHEARIIAALEHSNILPIYDFGEFQRQLYIVMRYVSGGSLLDRIVDRGGLPDDEVIRIGEAVAQALERAHAENVVHRDLKPANILLDRFGTPYLSDFGLAAVIGVGDEENVTAGTLIYMPPEQMFGRAVDHRADIYAFAITLFQMITGEFPFEGQGALCLRQAQFGEELPDPRQYRHDLPPGVTIVLRTATAMDVDARYNRATVLMAELAATLRGEGRAAAGFRAEREIPQEATPARAPTETAVEEELAVTLSGATETDLLATLPLAGTGPAVSGPLPPVTEEALAAYDPATIAQPEAGLLEARVAFQRMVRVWARGQGRFLTGATPFANIHAYYSAPEEYGLAISDAGREAMLRGAVEHDYALDFWLEQVPEPELRRAVFLHGLRSDAAAARARAVRLLQTVPDADGPGIALAAGRLLHAETDPEVRLAVVELLDARGERPDGWREQAYGQDIDLLLAEQALRDDTPAVAERAARDIGRLRSRAAVRHLVAHAGQQPEQVRRALAWARDEADALPDEVPGRLRAAAFTRLTLERLTANLGRLGLRYFLALLGAGIGLGLYVHLMFPTASLLALAHLYRVVGNGQTFGLVAGLGGTLAAALPLRLAGSCAERADGATLWPWWARLLAGVLLGGLAGAIAFLNFQVLALQFADPRLEIVALGGLGLALGPALAGTFRWPLVARLGASALTLFGALYATWFLNMQGLTDALIFLRSPDQVWLFGVMAILTALGIWGPEITDALRRQGRNPG
ncbi:MAG: protein kinase [Anaerolineae bacterium]|nr:protein kinase [Anaerolineae bacterium]